MVRRCLIIVLLVTTILLSDCSNGSGGGSSGGDGSSNSSNSSQSQYLVKPTGAYGVGFQDYHYINTGICPDPNYIPDENESYFSVGNQGGSGTNFCHEIMARIYYPASTPTILSPYYQPLIQQLGELSLELDPILSNTQLQSLNSLTSYSTANATIANGKFPVLLFSPGFSASAQLYENLITELVSHGYIVVGINSVFISGNIQLPNNVIVPGPITATESEIYGTAYSEVLSDLELIYNEINNPQSMGNNIFSKMDLTKIGAFSHSLGSLALINATHQNPDWFKAIAPTDVALSQNYESMAEVTVQAPTLYQFSDILYGQIQQYGVNISLTESSSYMILLSSDPDEQAYSAHDNFMDIGTIQYTPLFQTVIAYNENNPLMSYGIGFGSGWDITNSIRTNLVQFFNTFLQNEPNLGFIPGYCYPISPNTYIECGPGVIK